MLPSIIVEHVCYDGTFWHLAIKKSWLFFISFLEKSDFVSIVCTERMYVRYFPSSKLRLFHIIINHALLMQALLFSLIILIWTQQKNIHSKNKGAHYDNDHNFLQICALNEIWSNSKKHVHNWNSIDICCK